MSAAKQQGRASTQERLEKESRAYLQSHTFTRLHRARAHEPSLEELRSTPFETYVRRVLIGVTGDAPFHHVVHEEDSASTTLSETSSRQEEDEETTVTLIDSATNSIQPSSSSPHPQDLGDITPRAKNRHTVLPCHAPFSEHPPLHVDTRVVLMDLTVPPELTRDTSSTSTTSSSTTRTTLSLSDFLGTPDYHKLADGLAKVTLPQGWWSLAPYHGDITGRGPLWSRGSPLGDMQIATPIKQVLSGIGGIYEYTMMELPSISVHDFRTKADNYFSSQLRIKLDKDAADSDQTMEDLARHFWRRIGPTMEHAVYGADMEGSLMADDDASGWNINRLETCLRLLRADAPNGNRTDVEFQLPGVTNSYLYFGMWASVFAAHTEDMNLFSINYLHAGSPKYWYSIAAEDAPRFESLATHHFNAAFRTCPEFLRHKRYLLSPSILKKAGIPFVTQVQRPGDAIVTFPGAYHFGFNTGFNVAESTNFAVPEWVPAGVEANICKCHPDSVQIDMRHFKELLLKYISHCQNSSKPISYSEWARLQAQRRHEASFLQTQVDSSFSLVLDSDTLLSSNRGPLTRFGDKFIVQVFPPAPDARPNTKKRKIKPLTNVKFHFCIKRGPKSFAVGNKVLCFQNCSDKVSRVIVGKRWYTGTIIVLMDGQARVSFDGMTRRDDCWVSLECGDIYHDGGPASQEDVNAYLSKHKVGNSVPSKNASTTDSVPSKHASTTDSVPSKHAFTDSAQSKHAKPDSVPSKHASTDSVPSKHDNPDSAQSKHANPDPVPSKGANPELSDSSEDETVSSLSQGGPTKKAIEITSQLIKASIAAKQQRKKKSDPATIEQPKKKKAVLGTHKLPPTPRYVVKLVAPRLIPEESPFGWYCPTNFDSLTRDLSAYNISLLRCLDLSGSSSASDSIKLTLRCIHCATFYPIESCQHLALTLAQISESHFKITFRSMSSNGCCNYLPLCEKRLMLKSWPKRHKAAQALTPEWCRELLIQHGLEEHVTKPGMFHPIVKPVSQPEPTVATFDASISPSNPVVAETCGVVVPEDTLSQNLM